MADSDFKSKTKPGPVDLKNTNTRLAPLPQSHPKPALDDPEAPIRLERILKSSTYIQADEDTVFLNQPVTRGIRIQLDYFKTEEELQKHGVKNSVVVFGSTRIHEPAAAQRAFNAAQQALLQASSNPIERRQAESNLAIAKRLLAKSKYYEEARHFAHLVADHGKKCPQEELVVITGGGPGIMEAANRGAFDAKVKTVGLNIHLPHEQYPNPYVTPELCFQFHYFAMRKLHFVQRARALVAFPGGYGTFDELFETLTLIQTRTIHPVPIVLVGKEFWSRAVHFEFLRDEGVIDPEDVELFHVVETAEEAWVTIQDWYAHRGLPMLLNTAE